MNKFYLWINGYVVLFSRFEDIEKMLESMTRVQDTSLDEFNGAFTNGMERYKKRTNVNWSYLEGN